MAEHGDMFWNRNKPNILVRMMGPLIPILFRFGKSQRFKPDISIRDGYDFSEFGFQARALSIPEHSKGSIGILTAGGDLFENTEEPTLNSIMDDLTAANASIDKLKSLAINTVYPGHGKPFPMELFVKNHQ